MDLKLRVRFVLPVVPEKIEHPIPVLLPVTPSSAFRIEDAVLETVVAAAEAAAATVVVELKIDDDVDELAAGVMGVKTTAPVPEVIVPDETKGIHILQIVQLFAQFFYIIGGAYI